MGEADISAELMRFGGEVGELGNKSLSLSHLCHPHFILSPLKLSSCRRKECVDIECQSQT